MTAQMAQSPLSAGPRSPDHTRLSAQLPPVYQEDAASFAQLDAYLGIADEMSRAVVEGIDDLLMALGPDAPLRWPTDVALDAGADAVLDSWLATFDELAAWTASTFPLSWQGGETGVARRREMLSRMARLWRRRGTPRGFLSWFCLWFGVSPVARPYLLEHFKAPGLAVSGEPYTATLFVPSTDDLARWERREEVVDFVRHYAPAHVAMRVCFVAEDAFAELAFLAVLGDPPRLPANPTAAQVAAYASAVDQQQRDLNALLCSVVSVVSHDAGVHVHDCIDEGPATDRLDVGFLPTTGLPSIDPTE